MSEAAPETFQVDPKRLAWGTWEYETGRETGEGDVISSYSADLIGAEGKVRRPFTFDGNLWVTVNLGGDKAEAYRLIPLQFFNGKPMSYRDKVDMDENGDAARADPMGFYHAMLTTFGRNQFVLIGPPCIFVAAEPTHPEAPIENSQLTLFT